MKINKYVVIGVILLYTALLIELIVCHYEINEYRIQIIDLRHAIRYNEIADSLLGLQTDTAGRHFIVTYKNEKGSIMTYKELMETVEAQERIILKQDVVIRNAKKIYKFNYAVKDSGNVVMTKFWNKTETSE